ncbi:MAG: CAP domain-containing protein [Candidatus Wildermuthbacteria bacterium]|nr:CAP domain-containing protein [Candidatus Wildermuthbacteria bacterium]
MVATKTFVKISFAIFLLGLSFLYAGSAYALTTNEVVQGVNAERTKAKAPLLKTNAKLQRAAQLKAEDMVKDSYFSHVKPNGKTPWAWFKESGYSFSYAGENLAINYSNSAEVMRSWMESKTHRANILNKNFTETGIGIAKGFLGNSQVTYVVQFFGKPALSKSKAPSSMIKKPPTGTPISLRKSVLGETTSTKPNLFKISLPSLSFSF